MGNVPSTWHGLLPAARRGLSVFALKGCSSALWLSCSDVLGPPVLLSYYVVCVISCGPGALSSLSPFLGCCSGSSELAWGFVESLRTYELHCPTSGCALHPHLCLGWTFWVIPCYVFPRSLSWCEVVVSFTFVMGFVANIQAPPLLLGLRALLYRPNQRETIAMGDCYILCGRSGVTWSALATNCQRCERFPFATGCNRKELSKTTVSF